MIKRLMWLGVGLAIGAVVARQVTKAVEAYSPTSLAGSARNSAADLWGSVKDFVDDVREGMAEREEEISMAFQQGVSLDDLDARSNSDARYNGNGHRNAVRFDDMDGRQM